VQPAAVHEHGGEDRMCLSGRVRGELSRHERPLLNEILSCAQLNEEHKDVQRDQYEGHDRDRPALRIVVA
jgi:hypothetical protein